MDKIILINWKTCPVNKDLRCAINQINNTNSNCESRGKSTEKNPKKYMSLFVYKNIIAEMTDMIQA